MEPLYVEDLGLMGVGRYKAYRHHFVLHKNGAMRVMWFEYAVDQLTGEKIRLDASSPDVWTVPDRTLVAA